MAQLFNNKLSLGIRLLIVTALSVTLMILDFHSAIFSSFRYYLDTIISPVHYVLDFPKEFAYSLKDISKTREAIFAENTYLKHELLTKQNDLLQLEYLKKENNRLRELLDSPLQHDEYKKVTQVLAQDSDPFTHQVIINKGKKDAVFLGQPLVDEKGVVGQVFKSSYKTSRAILICDTQHALPVQSLKNDIFMVAVGNGCHNDLLLEYLPNKIDLKKGDLLVTSGLDGVFPAGYPVAHVNEITFDADSAAWHITATPTADLKKLRYLLLLWNKEKDAPLQQESKNE